MALIGVSKVPLKGAECAICLSDRETDERACSVLFFDATFPATSAEVHPMYVRSVYAPETLGTTSNRLRRRVLDGQVAMAKSDD